MNLGALDNMIYDNSDYESMSWHDNRVHAIAFSPENYQLSLDLDHITRWFEPRSGDSRFSFLLAPATMCFENASNIRIDIEIGSIYEQSISELKRTYVRRTPNDMFDVWRFEIEFQHVGRIVVEATGFQLFLRAKPARSDGQFFSREERGGVNFDRGPPAT